MEKDEKIKPLITVIVPVYNAELWLYKCLDSLVYQTLENIEIIAVDNGSTDGTKKILEDYEKRFSEKVFIASIEHTNGPGGGRNYGLAHARASYIAFADADDYFDFHAMELLYDKAISGDYDIVCCANYDVKGNSIKKARELKRTTKEFVIRNGSMVFWNKLVKKCLFDLAGPVPENIVFEDIAYVSTLISYSDKIGYVDKPLYYYILRDDSGVNDLKSDRILHSLEAYKIALKNCNSDVKEQLIASIAHRVCYDMKVARWTFADKFIEYIKENEGLFDIPLVNEEKSTYDCLNKIKGFSDDKIAQTVYINAFVDRNFKRREYVSNESFYGETEVVYLDESNCNINILPIIYNAYQKREYEFVAQYFALEKIYENGGIYISDNIEIINTFNCLKYFDSFIGYLDNKNFTDKVFGGKAGNNLFCHLIETYTFENAYHRIDYSLADRIKNVLVVIYGINLDGKTRVLKDKILVLDPQVLVTDIVGEYHICRHDFSEYISGDEYVVMKKSVLNMLLTNNNG